MPASSNEKHRSTEIPHIDSMIHRWREKIQLVFALNKTCHRFPVVVVTTNLLHRRLLIDENRTISERKDDQVKARVVNAASEIVPRWIAERRSDGCIGRILPLNETSIWQETNRSIGGDLTQMNDRFHRLKRQSSELRSQRRLRSELQWSSVVQENTTETTWANASVKRRSILSYRSLVSLLRERTECWRHAQRFLVSTETFPFEMRLRTGSSKTIGYRYSSRQVSIDRWEYRSYDELEMDSWIARIGFHWKLFDERDGQEVNLSDLIASRSSGLTTVDTCGSSPVLRYMLHFWLDSVESAADKTLTDQQSFRRWIYFCSCPLFGVRILTANIRDVTHQKVSPARYHSSQRRDILPKNPEISAVRWSDHRRWFDWGSGLCVAAVFSRDVILQYLSGIADCQPWASSLLFAQG